MISIQINISNKLNRKISQFQLKTKTKNLLNKFKSKSKNKNLKLLLLKSTTRTKELMFQVPFSKKDLIRRAKSVLSGLRKRN